MFSEYFVLFSFWFLLIHKYCKFVLIQITNYSFSLYPPNVILFVFSFQSNDQNICVFVVYRANMHYNENERNIFILYLLIFVSQASMENYCMIIKCVVLMAMTEIKYKNIADTIRSTCQYQVYNGQ